MSLLFVSLPLILLFQTGIAQKTVQDCYTTYKNKGDAFYNGKKYDLSMEQYQIAKKCKFLTNYQTKTLDSLIAIMSKLQSTTNSKIKRKL